MNPWAFCPLLISAVGILLTTEVQSVFPPSYLLPHIFSLFLLPPSPSCYVPVCLHTLIPLDPQVMAVFLAYSRTSVVMASGRELCYVLLLGDSHILIHSKSKKVCRVCFSVTKELQKKRVNLNIKICDKSA